MRARDLEAIRGEVLPAGRDVSSGELRALFEHLAADPGPIARRDAAILTLLFAAGVRRTELVSLQLADIDPETGIGTGGVGYSSVVYSCSGGSGRTASGGRNLS